MSLIILQIKKLLVKGTDQWGWKWRRRMWWGAGRVADCTTALCGPAAAPTVVAPAVGQTAATPPQCCQNSTYKTINYRPISITHYELIIIDYRNSVRFLKINHYQLDHNGFSSHRARRNKRCQIKTIHWKDFAMNIPILYNAMKKNHLHFYSVVAREPSYQMVDRMCP